MRSVPRTKAAQRGFTLVEMAIVIAIAGLIVTFVVNSFGTQMQVRRETTTRDKMDVIAKLVGNRLIQNGQAPCPADPAVAQNNAAFGQARAACATAALSEGIVPFQTLGIPVDMARDGWSRFITYRTSPTIAVTASKAAACTAVRAGVDVNVNDQNGNPVVANTVIHAVVLISHGQNGVGAFLADGTATRQAGTFADANETANGTTGSANKISANPGQSPLYDDVTVWKTVPVLVTSFNTSCP